MIFGVAGVPTNYKGKFKDMFNWLRSMNLNAFEIQCVYGFKMSDVNKEIYKKEKQDGFNFSIISIFSLETNPVLSLKS